MGRNFTVINMTKLQKISIIFLLCIGPFLKGYAGDSVLVNHLLERILQLQAKESSVFPKGSLPTYRYYALNKDRSKADVNVFFTALVSHTLHQLKENFSTRQQILAEQIIQDAYPVYAKFKNTKGRNTYNFWPTDTPKIFPNAGWINYFDKGQALADDLDDTVMILLAMNAPDAAARELHALMQSFTNKGEKKMRKAFRNYSDIHSYSTWFGQKMPVDFDVCVLANVLYFVQQYNLKWTAADSASLQFIEKIISDRQHIKNAAYVSTHYGRLPVILYHLSRLMSVKTIPSLEKIKPMLIQDAKEALAQFPDFMDKVILSTSLLKWGVNPEREQVFKGRNLASLIEEPGVAFFIGDMASVLPDPLKKWGGITGIGKFYFVSPAYNYALVLEYLIWKNNYQSLANKRMD